jgi:hypothetical protein
MIIKSMGPCGITRMGPATHEAWSDPMAGSAVFRGMPFFLKAIGSYHIERE